MTVTIHTIAKRCGVSAPVVSAVINNNYRHCRVGEKKKKKIEMLIKQLNYVPNATAQNLVKRSTQIINIVIPSSAFFINAENNRFIMGFQEAVERQGYRINFTSLSHGFREYRRLDRIIADGILLFYWNAGHNPVVKSIQGMGYPLLVATRKCSVAGVSNIYYDNRTAMYKLAGRVVAAGYRKIIHVTAFTGDSYHRDGRQGIRRALQEAGLGPLKMIKLEPAFDEKRHEEGMCALGQQAVREMLAAGGLPEAAMFSHDLIAFGATRELARQGFCVPDDIAVTGNGNHPFNDLWGTPLATTEDKSVEAGTRAGDMMVHLIQNKTAEPLKVKIPLDIIVRGSIRLIPRKAV